MEKLSSRKLALAFVPVAKRESIAVLWRLDETLGRIVSSTREPLIGQMRLTWWYEQLVALDDAQAVQGEPLLAELEARVLSKGVTGAELAVMIEGWEALLEPLPLSEDLLLDFAGARGATLFELSARLLGTPVMRAAGEAWALADFARKCSDGETARRARALAAERRAGAGRVKPKALRLLVELAGVDMTKLRGRGRWALLRALFG